MTTVIKKAISKIRLSEKPNLPNSTPEKPEAGTKNIMQGTIMRALVTPNTWADADGNIENVAPFTMNESSTQIE